MNKPSFKQKRFNQLAAFSMTDAKNAYTNTSTAALSLGKIPNCVKLHHLAHFQKIYSRLKIRQ
jgi:hypothetical protein